MNILFPLSVVIFLAASIVAAAFSVVGKRTARQAVIWAMLLASLLAVVFSVNIAFSDGVFHLPTYTIVGNLALSFTIDRLAAFFLGIISFVSAAALVYSLKYVEHEGSDPSKNFLVSMMSLFIVSMLLVVAADNVFTFLFFWETMSLSSFFLVMFDRQKAETKRSATFYFVMTQMSTTFLMLGLLALYSPSGSFSTVSLAGMNAVLKAGVFLSLFVGFGIKAGVMPFHKWLPYAHSASPSNISALMSGVMIKVAIYGMIRYILMALSPDLWWGVLVLSFGVFSALLGVMYALKEHDIKKLLAYHSIENIGIILMGMGLYLIFTNYGLSSLADLALIGALFHTLNHALFKSLLFLTTGSVVAETGTRNIEKMGGLFKAMPYTGTLFLIGSMSIAALPPFNGFVSELMIFQAFFQSFQIDSALVRVLLFVGLSLFALTSALAAACFVKAFGIIFLAMPRSKEAKAAHEVSWPMIVGPAILAIACAALGIFSFQLFHALGFTFPIPNLMLIGLGLSAVLLLSWVLMRATGNRQTRTSETWGCGLTAQDSSMEYTASGFSEPILTIFKPIYRTKKTAERSYNDASGANFRQGSASVHTFKVFEERLYLPIVRAVQKTSDWVSNLHDVDLDTYILYSFVAVVLLVITTGWLLQ